MPYRQVKLELTPAQQKKALRGLKIRLKQSQIGRGQLVMLHPVNANRVLKAKRGVDLDLSPGEIMQTAAYHGFIPKQGKDMEGSGIFDSIWSGLKSTSKWLKDSGVGSVLADAAATAATPFVGAQAADIGRQIVKQATGVGLRPRVKRTARGSGLYI